MSPLLRRAIALCLVLALPIAAATAQAQQPQGGTPVTFDTQDASGRALALAGQLWLPAEPAQTAKGAVVLVHGSAGWTDQREGHHARALQAAGYAALAIDAFGPRSIRTTTDDQSQVSSLQMARDAFAARAFLIERGFAAPTLAVMGFSKGGAAALFAADRTFLARQEQRFAAAIAFYPACNTRPRAPKPASTVYLALAEKDDYAGVQPCEALAAAYREAGGKIDVKVYADAAHGFDGDPAHSAMIRLRFAENYIDCTVLVEEDGSHTYAGKRYARNDPALLADMRGTCVKKGASVWTHARQKEAATRDVIDFLSRALIR